MSTKRLSYRITACLALLALGITACGSDASSEDTTDTGTGDAAATDGDGDEDLSPEVATAMEEAEAAGLQFISSREELVARAEEEPPLNVIWALAPDEGLRRYTDQFTEQYGIEVNEIQGLDGVEARQRFILEAEAGAVENVGVAYAAAESFTEIEEFCDWDIYGMSQAGILDIPVDMVDPNSRTTVGHGNSPGAFIYNLEAFEDRPLPETWEDVLNQEVFGAEDMDVIGDTRFSQLAPMVNTWGREETLQYAEDLAALDPIWVQRTGPTVEQMELGEYDAYPFANIQSVYKRMQGAPPADEAGRDIIGDNIGIRILEPVPVRMTDTHCVLNDDINPTPASSILFMEWLATDGQVSYHDPDNPEGIIAFENSVFSDVVGGNNELLADFELSRVGWDSFQQQAEYIEEISSAAGFPEPVQQE